VYDQNQTKLPVRFDPVCGDQRKTLEVPKSKTHGRVLGYIP